LFLLVCGVICFWIVAGLALLLYHESKVLWLTYHTGEWSKQWMRLVAYALVGLLFGTSIIKLCKYLGSAVLARFMPLRRLFRRTSEDVSAIHTDCFYCRRDSHVKGPLAIDAVRDAIKSGQLRDDDLISRTSSGPWMAVAEGKEQYVL
jgi:hypothetical protein